MIKLKDLLLEKMTFKQLLALSDDGRKNRSKNIDTRSLRVVADKNSESSIFSYKSKPSTTGKRHQGYIEFSKSDINKNKQAIEWNCIVDCTCPDFKFRFAYNVDKQGASVIGSNSWNKNNGATPLPINNKIGLCKHLISLTNYLKTAIATKANNRKKLKEIFGDDFISNNRNLKNKIINLIAKLKKERDKLHKEYDDADNKSLPTIDIQKRLIELEKELNGLIFLKNSLK